MTSLRRWALAASLLPLVLGLGLGLVPRAGVARADMHASKHSDGPSSTTALPVHWSSPVTTPAPSTISPAPAPATPPLPTPPDMAGWALVAQCETGGDWSMRGPLYSGGLGMTNANWVAYGGLAFAPTAGSATPAEQVTVAERVETPAPFADTPAGGCQGW